MVGKALEVNTIYLATPIHIPMFARWVGKVTYVKVFTGMMSGLTQYYMCHCHYIN